MIASFKPELSQWLATLYAIASGLFMGRLAFSFEAKYPGIALQTVQVIACVLVVMFALKMAGWLRTQPQPDYIQSYALGLMVTLVWLYVSILRLLANLRR